MQQTMHQVHLFQEITEKLAEALSFVLLTLLLTPFPTSVRSAMVSISNVCAANEFYHTAFLCDNVCVHVDYLKVKHSKQNCNRKCL